MVGDASTAGIWRMWAGPGWGVEAKGEVADVGWGSCLGAGSCGRLPGNLAVNANVMSHLML
jgi:hypothetical protein